ncbi:hypothetical protein HNP40_003178 [Mycobacteroides chelonae]|nr:hypothetical protein [Mycobacteroides chelonae]
MRQLVILVALAVVGCSNAPEASSSAPAQPPAAACDSKYTRDQFIGTWLDESSTITLAADGSLVAQGTQGHWEFTNWEKTPQAAPSGQENKCVLWLKEPPLDLVYFPLNATPASLSMSYVGRGNTITWTRQGSD